MTAIQNLLIYKASTYDYYVITTEVFLITTLSHAIMTENPLPVSTVMTEILLTDGTV